MRFADRSCLKVCAVLVCVIARCCTSETVVGGVYNERVIWDLQRSPYLVTDDVIIEKSGQLLVKAGVVVNFRPGLGITVRGGVLTVMGSEYQRVLMTSSSPPTHTPADGSSEGRTVRLVDGRAAWHGRLQLLHGGRWRYVCSDASNWTVSDAAVTCRQLGFSGGRHVPAPYYSLDHDDNDNRYDNYDDDYGDDDGSLFLPQPQCDGGERSLQLCRQWTSRVLAPRVCSGWPAVWLQCDAAFTDDDSRDAAEYRWRGVRLQHAAYQRQLTEDNTLLQHFSSSRLQYLDVLYAGVGGTERQVSSAIESVGVPAQLYRVRVRHSAATGINVTRPGAMLNIGHCELTDNAGDGIFVSSSYGMVRVHECDVSNNGGDGVRYVHVDAPHISHGRRGGSGEAGGWGDDSGGLQQPEQEVELEAGDFCRDGTVARQVYPLRMRVLVLPTAMSGQRCSRLFNAPPGRVFTLHFEWMSASKSNAAHLYVYDGARDDAPLLASVAVQNDTRPQSVASSRGQMLVIFHATSADKSASSSSRHMNSVGGGGGGVVVLFTVTVGKQRQADLVVSNSRLVGNAGRGLAVDNLRSAVRLLDSHVASSGHVAGVHVRAGAGLVHVAGSNVTATRGHAVLVHYAGGTCNVSHSRLADNSGSGVRLRLLTYVDRRERRRLPFNYSDVSAAAPRHRLLISRSVLSDNSRHAVAVGNSCVPLAVRVTQSELRGSGRPALLLRPCRRQLPGHRYQLQLLVAANRFVGNRHLAVSMAPAVNVRGVMRRNRFTDHRRGTLQILSDHTEVTSLSEHVRLQKLWCDVNISDNVFERNAGPFVVSLGAWPDPDDDGGGDQATLLHRRRQLLFTRNLVRDNSVSEPFAGLNARSRVAAAVTVASTSAVVHRNIIVNPNSSYELGVWLQRRAVVNCSHNWLGFQRAERVYERIFDRKDRYSLARAAFVPFLLSETDPNTVLVSPADRLVRLPFKNAAGDRIGGEISGSVVLNDGVENVRVTRDIYVHPSGKLSIPFGVKLLFDHGVGMMVAGELHAEGSSLAPNKRVTFSLQPRAQPDNVSLAPVRLTAGRTEREGLLQVHIDGEWGGVCARDWSLASASVACRQLGWVLNPLDWHVPSHALLGGRNESRLLISYVRCGPTDNDLTQCAHTPTAQLEGAGVCDAHEAVTLRCYDVSWAGLRLALPAATSTLKHVWIEKAGLFDHATNKFAPALQMDVARHKLHSVVVSHNDGDGVAVLLSDHFSGRHLDTADTGDIADSGSDFGRFAGDSGGGVFDSGSTTVQVNRPHKLQARQNAGHGLVLHSLALNLSECIFEENGGAGLHYSGAVSRAELRQLVSWVRAVRQPLHRLSANVDDAGGGRDDDDGGQKMVWLPPAGSVYVIADGRHIDDGGDGAGAQSHADQAASLHFTTERDSVVAVQVISAGEPLTRHDIAVFDSHQTLVDTPRWRVRSDVVKFPVVSSSSQLTLQYVNSTRHSAGSVVLFLTSVKRSVVMSLQTGHGERRWSDVVGVASRLSLVHSVIRKNQYGVSMHLHNSAFSDCGDQVRMRHANASIELLRCHIADNRHEALLLTSDRTVGGGGDEDSLNQAATLTAAPLAETHITLNDTSIVGNGAGAAQISHDLWHSRNIFHWLLSNVTVTSNKAGGLLLSLPRVATQSHDASSDGGDPAWRRAHSLYVLDSRMTANRRFGIAITGHFCRVQLLRNLWRDNSCSGNGVGGVGDGGLLKFGGCEKQLLVADNEIVDNSGRFVADLSADSQSDAVAVVSAEFRDNDVRHNRHGSPAAPVEAADTRGSYVVAVRGVQLVNVSGNLFDGNNMRYVLVAAVRSSSASTQLLATRNWWGSWRPAEIRRLLLDFDDWNSYATVRFTPFLTADRRDSRLQTEEGDNDIAGRQDDVFPSTDNTLTGPIYGNITLPYRRHPYLVSSDVTVMPGASLRVLPGVVLEFAPSVGLLVLGRLEAVGQRRQRIVMRPMTRHRSGDHLDGQRLATARTARLASEHDAWQVRLCSGGSESLPDASTSGVGEDDGMQRRCNTSLTAGYLQIFAGDRRHWLPACDGRFSERTGAVVCRQLANAAAADGGGQFDAQTDFFDVNIRHGRMADDATLRHVLHASDWPPALDCNGDEATLAACRRRLPTTGETDETMSCRPAASGDGGVEDHVFIDCGRRMAVSGRAAWGGVRFSTPTFEQPSFYGAAGWSRASSTAAASAAGLHGDASVLRFVDIVGAGRLHGHRSPAVLAVSVTPQLESVNVTHGWSDAVTLVNPADSLQLRHVKCEDNLGVGVNTIMLSGQASSSDDSSFEPLTRAPLPHRLFGMLDACDAHKRVPVQQRVLFYYKYDHTPVDCVKIFTASGRAKMLGFRLLQFNLAGRTRGAQLGDSLRLYSGDIYNSSSTLLVHLDADIDGSSGAVRRLYKSAARELSVHLRVAGGAEWHGFAAEVVSLPSASVGYKREVRHNISHSEMRANDGGGVSYVAAGEVSPPLALTWSRLSQNCRSLGDNAAASSNWSTCQAAVDVDVQNAKYFHFENNLLRDNVGGVRVLAGSSSVVTALRARLTANVLVGDRCGGGGGGGGDSGVLTLRGRSAALYQHAHVTRNYITRATCHHASVLRLHQILANFSENLVHNNLGRFIMNVVGVENVQQSGYQVFTHNSFYRNVATDGGNRATIVTNSVGQRYSHNVLVNNANDYELAAVNQTAVDVSVPLFVDARHNWWGYNRSHAIQARIKDSADGYGVLTVDSSDYLVSNTSLLEGECRPGWELIGDTCFMYVPVLMDFSEAKRFCLNDNASMPYVLGDYDRLVRFIAARQPHYDWRRQPVWVQHVDVAGSCSVLVRRRVSTADCRRRLTFLCEMDPHVSAGALTWMRDGVVMGVLGAGGGAVLFVALLLALWLAKSRQRRREKLLRRNSIRGSLRSVRSLASSYSNVTLNSMAGGGGGGGPLAGYHRRRGAAQNQQPASAGLGEISLVPAGGGVMYGVTAASSDGRRGMHSLADHRAAPPAPMTATRPISTGYDNPAYGGRSTFSSVGGAASAAVSVSLATFDDQDYDVDEQGHAGGAAPRPPSVTSVSQSSDSSLELKKRPPSSAGSDATAASAVEMDGGGGGASTAAAVRRPDDSSLQRDYSPYHSVSQPLETAM